MQTHPDTAYNPTSRFYDPLVARFIQPDSIVPGATDPQNLNRDSNVGNNPVTFNDPTGHCKWYLACLDETDDVVAGGAGLIADGAGATADLATDVGEFVVDEVIVDGYHTGVDIAEGAVDRGTTYTAYQASEWWRRAKDPGQTIHDLATGTFFVEEAAAAYIIGVDNADLYWDGAYCGEHGACFTGLDGLPSRGITLGHTVLFRSQDPDAGLIAHEFQHVFDIETVDSVVFHSTYFGEDLARWATVGGDNFWDVRAYNTGGRGQHYRDPTHFGEDPWLGGRISETVYDYSYELVTQ